MKILKSETVSFTLPKMLSSELRAITATGYYDSASEFIRDAMRNLLASRRELRIAIAVELYKKGEVSFGKAIELANTDIEIMKKILSERKIKRVSGARTKKEINKELKKIK